MAFQKWLSLPVPRTFLYLLTLRTGTELITISLLLNKFTGFYGLLAIFTGFSLSFAQASMYIYSILSLLLLAYLLPHIRRASPLQCLVLAWFYALDTVVNAAYTVVFAVSWFLAVAAVTEGKGVDVPRFAPGMRTINETNPGIGIAAGVGAGVGVGVGGGNGSADPSLAQGIASTESVPSIVIIVLLNSVRVYFVLILMAYARLVIRQHIANEAAHAHTDGAADDKERDVFQVGSEFGMGWGGRMGRALISVGRGWWLGSKGDGEWLREVSGRFRRSGGRARRTEGLVRHEGMGVEGEGPAVGLMSGN